MGVAGAKYAAAVIRKVIEEKGEANLIFASSPSQMDVLTSILDEDVDWGCVNAFHMDEYIGIDIEHKASFANYLRENFFCKVQMKSISHTYPSPLPYGNTPRLWRVFMLFKGDWSLRVSRQI